MTVVCIHVYTNYVYVGCCCASRHGKCFVVVDGKAGRNYAITSDRWPVADLIFSPTGRYLAYKTIRAGKSYLVVNGEELGPYDNVVSAAGGKVPGIGDFRFTDKEDYFLYRAETGDGMVACAVGSATGRYH